MNKLSRLWAWFFERVIWAPAAMLALTVIFGSWTLRVALLLSVWAAISFLLYLSY